MEARRMMAAARSKKRTPMKGRTMVALGLAVFITFAVIVVWRRSIGVSTAVEMGKLEREKRLLRSQATTLRSEIEMASSRSRIVAAAEKRLGLHVATEFQRRAIGDSTVTSPAISPP
jgi:cell division protein FtsL